MTAIVAAIIELKAHCRHTSEIIQALERFVSVVEDAHGPAPTVTPGTEPSASAAARVVVDTQRASRPVTPARGTHHRKLNGKPAKARSTPATAGKAAAAFSAGADILRILGTSQEPIAPKNIIRLTKLPRWKVMRTILDLSRAGSIVRIGHHRSAKYQLAHTARPGAAAGTQSALTAGSSSASGRTPVHARVAAPSGASAGDFEVAWNGTKERNGTAPSIVGDREIRR